MVALTAPLWIEEGEHTCCVLIYKVFSEFVSLDTSRTQTGSHDYPFLLYHTREMILVLYPSLPPMKP